MNAAAHLPQTSGSNAQPVTSFSRLHDLTQRAIAASNALTCASIAGRAINDAEYDHLDHAAYVARRDLLDCLSREYGIDHTMADQLGALL